MGRRFETTRWSVVLSAGEERSSRALEELCEAYWPAVHAYVCRRGVDPVEAEDLTQGFFARLLAHRSLETVHPSRGRFRSFLLASVRHFLADEWDRRRAQKRGGDQAPVPLVEDSRGPAEGGASPERAFERRWAEQVVRHALGRLEADLEAEGRSDRFAVLSGYLTGDDETPYRDAGEALGISEGAVKVAVHRLRQRFGRVLRDEVMETVATPEEVDDELRHLLEVWRA